MDDNALIKAVAEKVKPDLWREVNGEWYVIPAYAKDIEVIPESYLTKVDITNLNHTFMIVEKMREEGFELSLGHGETVQGVLTWVRFTKEPESSYYHDKRPGPAICMAALKAMEEK